MRKNWIYAALVFLSLSTIAFVGFSSEIKVLLLRFYASSVIQGSLGGELRYKKAQFLEDGSLEIENLKLALRSRKKDSPLTVTVQKTRIEMGLSLWPLSLKLHASFEKPRAVIQKEATLSSLMENFKGGASILSTQAQVDIREGEILFEEGGIGDNSAFSLNASLYVHDLWKSTLEVKSAADHPGIALAYDGYSSPEGSLAIQCREADATHLFNFLAPSVSYLEMIRLDKGKVDGDLKIARGKGGIAAVRGSLVFTDFSFRDSMGHLEGSLPKFVFEADFQRKSPRIVIGKGSLKEDAYVKASPGDREPYLIHFQEGSIYIESVKTVHFQFAGISKHGSLSLPFEGKAHINVLHTGSETASLNLYLAYHEKSRAHAEVRLTEMGRGWRSLNIALSDFTEREFGFLQDASVLINEAVPSFQFERGVFSGRAHAHLLGKMLKEVHVDQIAFHQSSMKLPDQDLLIESDELLLKASVNLAAKDTKGSLKADIKIKNGLIEGKKPLAYSAAHCDADIEIENGSIKNLKAEGIVQGVFGKIDLDSTNPKGASIAFVSPLPLLSEHFPEKFRKAIRRDFSLDTVYVEAFAKDGPDSVDLRGALSVEGPDNETIALGKFGFRVLKAKERNKAEGASPNKKLTAQGPGIEVAVKDAASRPFGESLLVGDGWFFLDRVDLKRGVAPLLFIDSQGERAPLKLSGQAVVRGEFDDDGMQIAYDAENIKLEGEDFSIDLDRIYRSQEHRDNLTPATHYFNFKNATQFGNIPVMHGSYTDKGSGIIFEDISCSICPDGETIKVQKIEALALGVLFKGSALIDYSLPGKGVLDISVDTSGVSGRAMDLKNFLSHLKSSSYISYIPIDGEIASGDGDCRFVFKVRPSGTLIHSRIKGSLYEGSLSLGTPEAVFREIGFLLSYETEGALFIQGLQGTLLVGDPKKPSEYFLHSEGISIDDLSRGAGRFNLWMEGGGQEVLRLVGAMEGRKAGDRLLVEILPDKEKCHLLNLKPDRFSLTLLDWAEAHLFDLSLDIDLGHSDRSLKKGVGKFISFLPLGIPHAPESDVSGFMKVNLGYSSENAVFDFSVLFDRLKVNEHDFHNAEIGGFYRERTLHLRDFIFDDLSIAAEIAKEDVWKIRFLGGGIKDKVTIGLEGAFDPEHGFFGNVRLFEATPQILTLLDKFPSAFLEKLTGKVKGSGEFSIGKGDGGAADVLAKLNLKGGLSLDKLRAEFQKPMQLSYSSKEGLSLSGFDASFFFDGLDQLQGMASTGKDPVRLSNEGIQIPKLAFSITPKAMKGLGSSLALAFPEIESLNIPFPVGDTFLKGELFAFNADDQHEMSFSLEKGEVQLFGAERPFRQFLIESRDSLFRVSSDILMGSKWIGVKVQTNDPLKRKGSLELYEKGNGLRNEERLSLQWRNSPPADFKVVKAYGSLSGVGVDLSIDEKVEGVGLKGSVDVDIAEALPLFTNTDKPALDPLFHHGRGKFTGTILIPKEGLYRATAQGTLALSSFSIKNFLIDKIDTEVQAGLDGAVFTDVHIEDPAGKADIKELTASFAEGGIWRAPKVSALGLRPASIRTMNGDLLVKNKALKINELIFDDLAFSPTATDSVSASGWLRFSNVSKSLFQNTLFQIPMELVTRLGLNPSVLTPVKGEVFFTIADKKIVITKLKDVYSEGRGSKFFLAGGAASYVDFDGNVMMQIRMKQYNILFKIAELITVTVKGTYSKPVYSLQKQEAARKKEPALKGAVSSPKMH